MRLLFKALIMIIDATSANVVYPISPIVVIDNKKKYLQNI